ncbi:MAG: ABC transporter ATP-binding protein [Clostridia bacterium]|nr:ABC transporter ATP-binding protein [Clostridia bacterium]
MIKTHSLVRRFDGFTIISYDDYVFEDGKSYVMLGASGCGKSTFLNMLAGVLSPSEGNVEIDGVNMTALSQHQRDSFRAANVGYIFQDFRLLEDMSVQDNIDILKLEGVDVSRSGALLKELGILSKRGRRVAQLSGGEKQRVAIARALVKQPSFILADEPTGNLNYAIGRKVTEELLKAARGKTLICVTHDDRLSELFDVVIDMNELAHAEECDTNA